MATKLYWTDADSNKVITVIFDAVTAMTPEDTVDITDHPVEVGADVTDHARSNSGRLTIEGIMSETPNPVNDPDAKLVVAGQNVAADVRADGGDQRIALDIPTPPLQFSESGLITAGVAALKGAIFGAPKALVKKPTVSATKNVLINVLQRDSNTSRIRTTYDTLLKVKDDHTLITVLTLHRDHFAMMIEKIAEPRAAADGASARFQIDLKQVRTVSSASVQAPKPSEPRAQKPVNGGSKNVKPLPNPGPSVSVALNVFNVLHKY